MRKKMLLEVNHIKKSFGKNKIVNEVLKGVSLSVKQKEFVAITGRSGSGKSTLLNIIGGLEKPDFGTVNIDNKNIYKLRESELCNYRKNEIGFVFQAFHLIPVLTVWENITLPQVLMDKSYAEELLEAFDLTVKINAFPSELSGGEQQRVVIARALINHPKIVLADEPTGNLDSVSEKNVIQIFQRCAEEFGAAILMVTHNEEIALQTDRVIHIEDGVADEI